MCRTKFFFSLSHDSWYATLPRRTDSLELGSGRLVSVSVEDELDEGKSMLDAAASSVCGRGV